MKRNRSQIWCISKVTKAVFVISLGLFGCHDESTLKPNIIIIMADDMGYSDLGCYGSEIQTANLDLLAREGLRFTQFYNVGRCSPSRASLLTGLYPHKVGVGWLTTEPKGNTASGYKGNLDDRYPTIPEILKGTGYVTYMCGKWHVTEKKLMESNKPVRSWPSQRGFDQFFGTINGLAGYFKPVDLKRNNASIPFPEDFYYTDAISDTAVSFITNHTRLQADRPFFMYIAYTAPHFPLQARPGDIERYEQKYQSGWDAIRQDRYRNLKSLGIIDTSMPLPPRDEEVAAWSSLPRDIRTEMARRMAVYAAQIDVMDKGIGRILSALEKTGQRKNTCIFFLSDNGASAEYKSELDPDPALLGTAESYESYRKAWAHVSNTPFKRYKHWVHEGGIAAPLIVSWPGGEKKRDRFILQPAHIIDLMPTCLDLAGVKDHHRFKKENSYTAAGGISLKPFFAGKKIKRDTLYWEHEGNRAIRIKDWKLVSRGKPVAPYIGQWKLYNLKKDRTERIDLAYKHGEKVHEMIRAWENWAKKNNVFPLDGRGGKPRRDTTGYAIQKEKFGNMPDGREVELYILKNYDGVEVRITNFGGIITQIIAPDKNQFYKDIVLGFDTFEEYLTKNKQHFGMPIGRYANRISYRHPHPHHTGDEQGLDLALWNAQIIIEENQEKLRLTYSSPDGHEGYPGTLEAGVDYYLTDSSELVIDYLAKTDKPTIVNLTNHSYFNLSGRDTHQIREYGTELGQYNNILDHEVYINAAYYTPVDTSLIPTGKILSVEGTKFDFKRPKVIGKASGSGYDHNFVINNHKKNELKLAAILRDPKTGRTMEVHTTQPGLQFYTGNFLSNKIKGKQGISLVKHAGLCLETQNFPDAPNQPNFPSLVLRPGEVYRHKTVYKFDVQQESLMNKEIKP